MTQWPSNFCGSYRPEDVTFLLKLQPRPEFVDLAQKEHLIQTGQRHYASMLSLESPPSADYQQLFHAACTANGPQMAADCLRLAAIIAARRPAGPITLLSLARGGTPIGVILKHLLVQVFARQVTHYSLSILRDRGVDDAALRFVLAAGHTPESCVFVDGWTGKGVIARELASSVAAFNRQHRCTLDAGLYVLTDLAGAASCAASAQDYLIPSSILNATVSGLISRSLLPEATEPDEFHGCFYYAEYEPVDKSRAFVGEILAKAFELEGNGQLPAAAPIDALALAQISADFIQIALVDNQITDPNLIKPGIGEATRVLLRRLPKKLLLRDPAASAVAHLVLLAEHKQVPIQVDPNLPYQAVSIIRSALDG